MSMSGGCLCGAVRYESAAGAQFSIMCCCRQCQHISGAGHAPQFALPRGAVTLSGPVKVHELKADSGNDVATAFCATCGSPIYKTSSGFAEFMFFHAGTLDDPSAYQPQQVVWTRSRQAWDHIDPALPRME